MWNAENTVFPRIIVLGPSINRPPLVAVNLEDEAEVEFDPAKLISDNVKDIDNEN